MRSAGRRLSAKLSGMRCIPLAGAAALLVACSREPIPAARGAPHTAGDVVSAAPSLQAVLESLPVVPAAAMTDEQQRGQALYATLCWSCHGPYGHGDGPAARAFPRTLPDLGRLSTAASVAQLVARMRAALPAVDSAASHALPADTLRLALAYLRSMSPTGSHGNAAAGRLLYATYCVQCHGVGGSGDGRLAAGFVLRPTNLRALRLAGRESHILETIRAGGSRDHRAYMPDWSLVLTDEQLWDLVAYIAVYRTRR